VGDGYLFDEAGGRIKSKFGAFVCASGLAHYSCLSKRR